MRYVSAIIGRADEELRNEKLKKELRLRFSSISAKQVAESGRRPSGAAG